MGGNNPELEAKLKEAFSDEKFVQELFSLEEPEDARKKLAERGVEMSLDEVKALPKAIEVAQKQQSGEELSEDELDDVAGGCLGTVSVLVVSALQTVGAAAVVTGMGKKLIDAFRGW